ncbi:Spindle assembly checkpoint kinase, putative [Perkinsus marinus ATCC 50983]|uniref:Spindle assembly checkpoint kinase, putative n=1 Tax=Perkinsus marinus (strain ATCC 50983 / TXsc) TaxID=423536 RepID=C5KPB9_PERM5|nr:Spindle assembly checkpoint kinase, putative [Perkinsus marinus ATCC 50983]EER13666.1 Spindle assembly checkpoint kinase, putative [Perkinsus marinus ATCC 50983]|eukprot:XP_002781871.1 Spindle assembly checkpoint kinase, putative [Perkinsus marinus ATCC 50983]
MTKGDMREHLVANVMRASASRCLTSPKAASSLPQELLDSGFELAEEARPQLGEGSFARVSLVVRKDKFYALKTVTKGPLEARNMAEHVRASMKREVSLHSRMCTHPNIVALHDYFEDSRRIYMLLEWCPFGSLSGALATLAVDSAVKTLPLSITARSLLRYLHDNGVIHRDIKPDNILISNLTPGDIQIRLTDFGWSCLENDTTQIYSKCGTPGFAAPEVFAGRQQTPASDIWSIGAVPYFPLRKVCSILYLLGVWEHKLEDPKWKNTIVGKRKTYHDTVDRMRPLVTLLEHDEKLAQGEERRVPEAVVDVLKGVFKEIVKREYVEANKLYLDMTVGNQLWPMGGINLGVVQQVCRRVEEKSHLLDDIEVKRYTQGVKRLITVAMTMAWICFQFIRVDVILMQPSTVIPHTAEMVLKPSQLAFKIVQAVAMGKQELLREDLCKAITEQVG